MEDETRFNPKIVAYSEENYYKIESKNYLKGIDKAIIARPINYCQVRLHIYSEISIIFSCRYEYFKCSTCLWQYKHIISTKNICNYLFK